MSFTYGSQYAPRRNRTSWPPRTNWATSVRLKPSRCNSELRVILVMAPRRASGARRRPAIRTQAVDNPGRRSWMRPRRLGWVRPARMGSDNLGWEIDHPRPTDASERGRHGDDPRSKPWSNPQRRLRRRAAGPRLSAVAAGQPDPPVAPAVQLQSLRGFCGRVVRTVDKEVVRPLPHPVQPTDIDGDGLIGQIVEEQDRSGRGVEAMDQDGSGPRDIDDAADAAADLRCGPQGVHQVLDPAQQGIRVAVLGPRIDPLGGERAARGDRSRQRLRLRRAESRIGPLVPLHRGP